MREKKSFSNKIYIQDHFSNANMLLASGKILVLVTKSALLCSFDIMPAILILPWGIEM